MSTQRPTKEPRHRASVDRRSLPRTGRRATLSANAVVLAVGALASLGLIWGGTVAAFTSTTPSGTNGWTTGTVTITDDDGGSAMFSPTGLVPGSTGSACITVTYSGNVAATVHLYASASSDPGAVASYLDLTVQEGTGGSYGTCTGFSATSTLYTGTLAGFTATKTAFSTGVSTWAPTTTSPRTYKVTYTLNSSTPNTKQGLTTTATFQWEAQA